MYLGESEAASGNLVFSAAHKLPVASPLQTTHHSVPSPIPLSSKRSRLTIHKHKAAPHHAVMMLSMGEDVLGTSQCFGAPSPT